MKHFPINVSGMSLGVVLVFNHNGVWHLQYLRDDRPGPVYTLAEIAQYATNGDVENAMLLSWIGFVAEAIEEYTGCPITRVPVASSNNGHKIVEEARVNPFLRMVRMDYGQPMIADWMVKWVLAGRIVFTDQRERSTMLFQIDDDVTIRINQESSIMHCRFVQQDSELESVTATFTTFHRARLKNQSVHHGYVFDSKVHVRS